MDFFTYLDVIHFTLHFVYMYFWLEIKVVLYSGSHSNFFFVKKTQPFVYMYVRVCMYVCVYVCVCVCVCPSLPYTRHDMPVTWSG